MVKSIFISKFLGVEHKFATFLRKSVDISPTTLKGIPDFKPLRAKMATYDDPADVFAFFDEAEQLFGDYQFEKAI